MSEEYVQYRQIHQTSRPVITMEFRMPGGSFVYPMLVDSGSDNVVLPAELMEPWGIDREDCIPVQGQMFFGVAEGLSFDSLALSFPDLWPDRGFDAPVVFSPQLDRRPYGLLGREPTLDFVRVRFGHADGHGFYICLY